MLLFITTKTNPGPCHGCAALLFNLVIIFKVRDPHGEALSCSPLVKVRQTTQSCSLSHKRLVIQSYGAVHLCDIYCNIKKVRMKK